MQDLKDPSLYINREISWLKFNTRVLLQAQNKNIPTLERLKFLAIYSSNLDEFYMLRVAGLKKLFREGTLTSNSDKLSPLEQLEKIREYLSKELKLVKDMYDELIKLLKTKENISIKKYHQINDKSLIDKYFFDTLYQVLVPIAVDSTHPFPMLNNLSFGLLLKLKEKDSNETLKYALVRIERKLPRFIKASEKEYILIEDLVARHIESLFPKHELIMSRPFRITRNADIDLEEEADDFLEIMEEGIKLRNRSEIVRLELSGDDDQDLFKFITKHISVDSKDIYEYNIMLNLSSLWTIVNDKSLVHLRDNDFKPRNLPPFDNNDNIFDILDKQNVLLYHPYDSFEPVIRLIQSASKNPKVIAIKITLYRNGNNSPIIKALLEAAQNGKQVTTIVELKARFDEESNLAWAKTLEDAGAHVVYGLKGFKVHAKVALITMNLDDGVKQYAHIGTGNYNPSTAKIYTDISYFSSEDTITKDITRFFHFLTGFSKRGSLNKLFMSPSQIKPKLLSLINTEITNKEKGFIIAKMNSLVDKDIIKALYRASIAGVKITLIIRGICCLKPGIKGLSDNIKVRSIIGKYLEHARIFYFKHSNPSIYISSADWMPRNLLRRVELLTGVEDEEVKNKLLGILNLQCNDNVLSYELNNKEEYEKVKAKDNVMINNHNLLEAHINKVYKSAKKNSPNYVKKLVSRILEES